MAFFVSEYHESSDKRDNLTKYHPPLQPVVYADFETMRVLVHVPICTYHAKFTSVRPVRFVYIDCCKVCFTRACAE